MQKKSILLITYYWPPSGGSGVQRWMYFAKYLKEFAYEIEVITVDEKVASYPSLDSSLNIHVKEITVHKTNSKEVIAAYSMLKSGKKNKVVPQGNVGNKKKSFLDKLSIFVRANFFVPDARIGWNKFAIQKAEQLIQNKSFDIIITTGPPHSTHLVGLHLKNKFNIKWIADFRDPWVEVYYNDLFKRMKFAQKKDEKLELNVLQRADKILTIGPSMKTLLAKKVTASKIEYIFNGFDENLFQNKVKTKSDKFILSYVGTLSLNYPYKSLIEALKLIQNLAIQNKVIQVQFTGKIDAEIITEFKKLSNIELKNNGVRSHQESVDIMCQSDLNLLLLPYQKDAQIMITGKVFEYLASGNPILAIGSKLSDATKIVQEKATNSACFEKEEINQIADFINKVIFSKSSSNPIDLEFSRKNTALKLANLLDNL